MSFQITEFTSYADIRAALGVSEDDLEDETLALDLYEDMLEVEFEEVGDTFFTAYQAAQAADTPTDAQVRLVKAARLFSTYAVAKQLTATLPLFAAKEVTDSKASVQRFDSPYRDVVKSVLDQYGRLRNRLGTALAAASATAQTTVSKTYFAVVSPSSDPITDSE